MIPGCGHDICENGPCIKYPLGPPHPEDEAVEPIVKFMQVWCVAYTSPIPTMDGPKTMYTREVESLAAAEGMRDIMERLSKRSPKKDLRIQNRFVTDWVDE